MRKVISSAVLEQLDVPTASCQTRVFPEDKRPLFFRAGGRYSSYRSSI